MEQRIQSLSICKNCGKNLKASDLFCPNCGKSVNDQPPDLSLPKRLSVYLISLLFPPFGFIPGIKYFSSSDSEVKKVGLIAIILSVVSTIIAIYLSMQIITEFNKELNHQIDIVNTENLLDTYRK